ncbi:MAG: transposase [Elusimicrobiota bacterium]
MRWKESHRFVVICKKLPAKPEEQPTLFTMERYSYQIFVTNLPLEAHNIWYFYRGRASIEIHIKELKQDYTLTKIPTNKFIANHLYFSLLLFAYNIVNWFKRLCLPKQLQNATLETIRTDILLLPAKLINKEHRNILKLPKEYISTRTLNYIMQKIENLKNK